MARVLVVEDDELLRSVLADRIERAAHSVYAAPCIAAAAEYLSEHHVDALLLDLVLPDGYGLDFLEQHGEQLEHTMVIVMTGVGHVEDAVRAMKLGAFDFLTKPVDQQELVQMIGRALAARGDRLEAQAERRERDHRLRQHVLASSTAFRDLLRTVEDVAISQVDTILVQGETGTGKNVLARHIHSLSGRRHKPLLEVSCPAIAEDLMASELFGHERGAFTDAKSTRQGVFEVAEGGTVVLDEIGELDVDVQAKLLDVLEERRIRRVGGSREIRVDVRVIALTNRDLGAMERAGQFRSDLRHRLSVFPIRVPPLRNRPEDILPLARHFLSSLEPKLGRRFERLSRDAENRLLSYSWPGNVRELRNVISRGMLIGRSPSLEASAIVIGDPGHGESPQRGSEHEPLAGIAPLLEVERLLVARAMAASGNNQSRAAELLAISRDQLRYRLKKFGLDSGGAGG